MVGQTYEREQGEDEPSDADDWGRWKRTPQASSAKAEARRANPYAAAEEYAQRSTAPEAGGTEEAMPAKQAAVSRPEDRIPWDIKEQTLFFWIEDAKKHGDLERVDQLRAALMEHCEAVRASHRTAVAASLAEQQATAGEGEPAEQADAPEDGPQPEEEEPPDLNEELIGEGEPANATTATISGSSLF